MRIVYELKRGEQAEIVLNNLFKQTQLQLNFGVILLAIVGGQPRILPIIDAMKRFRARALSSARRASSTTRRGRPRC